MPESPPLQLPARSVPKRHERSLSDLLSSCRAWQHLLQ